MKHLSRSLMILGILFSNLWVIAQTSEDRAKIQEEYFKANPQLRSARQTESPAWQKYLQAEARVKDYLQKNPTKKRTFVENGSVHFIKDIDAKGRPLYINTKSNRESGALIKADQLYKGGSLGVEIAGKDMVAGVWDTGQVRVTHELLSGKAKMAPDQTLDLDGSGDGFSGSNHMTHVTGTMVGKDLAKQPSARGIAHEATAICYDMNADLVEMNEFAKGGYLISNHSYGYLNNEGDPIWRFGAYNDDAMAWDSLMTLYPYYLPFIAGGNEQNPTALKAQGKRLNGNWTKEGYDLMTGSSAAKNPMTVGAVNADKGMSDYSNWGPTDDGRLKPEIVTRGTGINSAQYADAKTKMPSDSTYSGEVDSDGTSYAAPAAAAGGLLLQQYYKSVHGSFMKASTLKTLMLASAEDLGLAGPDHKFGWGLLNVEKAAQTIKYRSTTLSPDKASAVDTDSKGAYIEEITYNPTPTDSLVREITANGCEPLIVGIGWTDNKGPEQTEAEGIDPTKSRMVYDFDVIVRKISDNTITRAWKPSTFAKRTEAATLEEDWFEGNGGNFREVLIKKPTAGDRYRIIIRKKSSSPTPARMVSLVVMGTAYTKPTVASASISLCSPATATIASLSATGSNIKWYDNLKDTTALAATTTLAGKSYFAAQTIQGCSSARTEVKVTLTPAIAAPDARDEKTKFGTKATLDATCSTGTATWYESATSTKALGQKSFTTPELSELTDYFVACEQDGCTSPRTRQVVKMQLLSLREADVEETGGVNELKGTASASRRSAEPTENSAQITLNIYPNPTAGVFIWELRSSESLGGDMGLYNTQGQEKYQQNLKPAYEHRGTLDITEMQQGIYLLRFRLGEKEIVQKIVKN
jgi:serine protease AprX